MITGYMLSKDLYRHCEINVRIGIIFLLMCISKCENSGMYVSNVMYIVWTFCF